MKLRHVSIFAVAAMLAACGGGDEATEGADSTAVVVDTAMAAPAPLPADTGMVAPMDTTGGMATDSAAMGTDTTAGDTTKM